MHTSPSLALDLLHGHMHCFYFMSPHHSLPPPLPSPPANLNRWGLNMRCIPAALTNLLISCTVLFSHFISFVYRLFYSFDLKTESTRKLNNFDFQWTKTLYQNNLKRIAFFFRVFKGWRCNQSSVMIPKKISYWSPRKWNVKFHKIASFTWNFQKKLKLLNFPVDSILMLEPLYGYFLY